ncbi:MAG: hypothetical protein ACRDLO_00325, partial [Solirubrobacterales bacterium]
MGAFGSGRSLGDDGRLKEDTLRKRCALLVRAGYLEGRRWLVDRPGVLTATAAGLREGGIDLPPASVDTRTFAHDVVLTWMCIELELEFPDGRVLTEREIRAADSGVFEPVYSPGQLGKSGATQRIHIPDLAVEAHPGADPIAVEVELAPKGRRRLDQITKLYARARHLGGVRYYVKGEATERGVRQAMRRQKVNEFGEFAQVL